LDGFLSRSGNTGIIRAFFRDDVDIVGELWGCNEHAFGVLWADDMAGDSITWLNGMPLRMKLSKCFAFVRLNRCFIARYAVMNISRIDRGKNSASENVKWLGTNLIRVGNWIMPRKRKPQVRVIIKCLVCKEFFIKKAVNHVFCGERCKKIRKRKDWPENPDYQPYYLINNKL